MNGRLFRFSSGAEGDYVGLELGADIGADLDLDDFMVFGMDEQKATSFFRELLYKHVSAALSESSQAPLSGESDFIRTTFTQINVFLELVRAAEGVPRDAIYIVAIAAQKADEGPISMLHVRAAARAWYQRDKEANVPAEAKTLLRWIIDEVIGNRRARAFLLRQGVEAGHPLIGQLVDSRVLHILKRGVSAKDEPGARFDVYGLDYGCYVDLLATKNAPSGLFQTEDSSPYVSVPQDDYRSIRRAILNLSKYEERAKLSPPPPSD
jgi:hypothetical protein